jgi:hypothetical protein
MSSITIEDFNANFVVRIVNYSPVSNTSTVDVEFEVKCTVNNRVIIHKTNVDTSLLVEPFTTSDVTDVAWDNVQSNVNAWATTNVASEIISTYEPSTSTDDISLTDFNNNFTVKVTRFELYPPINPTHWCIGFFTSSDSHPEQNIYRDCSLSTVDYCNNTLCMDIVDGGWALLKQGICAWAATEFAKSSIIDTIYTPSAFA